MSAKCDDLSTRVHKNVHKICRQISKSKHISRSEKKENNGGDNRCRETERKSDTNGLCPKLRREDTLGANHVVSVKDIFNENVIDSVVEVQNICRKINWVSFGESKGSSKERNGL